jgi:type II secretory pathway pseudopilin PulG
MIIVAALLSVLVSSASTAQVADASAPTAAQVLAKAKQAAGGAAVDKLRTLHFREHVQILGISGDGEEWDDLPTGRFASYQQAGPVSNGDGFDGTTVWSQDATGLAHPTGGAEDVATALSQA